MCINFANIILESWVSSIIRDSFVVVYIGVIPVVAVEEERWACDNNWGMLGDHRSDTYLDV